MTSDPNPENSIPRSTTYIMTQEARGKRSNIKFPKIQSILFPFYFQFPPQNHNITDMRSHSVLHTYVVIRKLSNATYIQPLNHAEISTINYHRLIIIKSKSLQSIHSSICNFIEKKKGELHIPFRGFKRL